MPITLDLWRKAMLAKPGNRVKWRLMTWFEADYYSPATFEDPLDVDFRTYPDSWFIAPASLIEAYKNALATVEFLEANLEAYYQKSRHNKYIGNNP